MAVYSQGKMGDSKRRCFINKMEIIKFLASVFLILMGVLGVGVVTVVAMELFFACGILVCNIAEKIGNFGCLLILLVITIVCIVIVF